MAKSNYPNKLDTSIEIPAVRDNIVEVGSDVINSIRTAIFQIERTLGINPQGVSGNTVASRLNKSLDSNGNILKEALDSSGILSGPISDKDVSKTAAIKESKLDLAYPTTLLQDEISQIASQIDLIEAAVNDLSSTLAVHINPAAVNRHKGIAINIDAISDTGSSEGITSLDSTTSQGAFESIFSSHINYDGLNIALDNRSHLSNQVFFDNTNVSAYIESNDAQGAIEDLVDAIVGQADVHQNRFHSNGIERSSILFSPSNIDKGKTLLENQAASYAASLVSSDSNISRIILSAAPAAPSFAIEPSDVLTITSANDESLYQIFKANYSTDGLSVESIDVYGRFSSNSSAGITVSVYRNKNRESSYSGLLLTARENKSLDGTSYTNADIIELSNPSATSIVTKNIKSQEISSTNRYIGISVDGGTKVVLDLFDSSLSLLSESQNINSIIKKLNEQFAENRLSVSAYRLDYDDLNQSEIAIVHSIGNTSSLEHTIKITREGDNCIDSLGLEYVEDKVVTSDIGNSFYIQGSGYNDLGILLNESGLTLTPGTSEVFTGNINPLDFGVKKGDLISITDSASDDGTYVISSISSNTIIVNRNQLPGEQWVSTSDSSTNFIIYSNAVSLNGYAFRAGFGKSATISVFEIFLDKNRRLNLNELLSYQLNNAGVPGAENLASPCDFVGNVEVYTDSNPGILLLETSSSDPDEVLISLDGGNSVSIKHIKNNYIEVYSGKYNINLKVFVKDSDAIVSYASGGSFSYSLYGYKSVNKEENLILGKALYEAGNSRVSGFGKEYPKVFRDLNFGTTSSKDISSDLRNDILIQPHYEKRSNGVSTGLEVYSAVDNGTTYTVSISSGICYVKGKRFEISEHIDFTTDVPTGTGPTVDKFYVAIDEYGKFVFSPADPVSCACLLDPSRYCILASVENSLSVINSIDLRLFINDLDLKILNSITVSPIPGMGHFSSVNKAIKYAKRFSELFPKAGTPTIHLKSGIHKAVINMNMDSSSYTGLSDEIQPIYNDGMWISFPVNIIGEGESTVLDFIKVFNDLPESSDDRATAGNPKMEAFIGIAGPGLSASRPVGDSDTLNSGFVNLSNFKTNLTGICIYDPSTEDGGGNVLNWGININNIIFDYSSKVDFVQANRSVLLKSIDTSSGNSAGNINITNCQFLNTLIRLDQDAADYRNINILNNVSRGRADSSSGGASNYLVYVGGSGHIFDFNDSPSENNINFIGNIIADNNTANSAVGGPKIDFSGNHPWGERFSRDVNIGAELNAVGSANIGGDLTTAGDAIIGGAASIDAGLTVALNAVIDGSTTSDAYNYNASDKKTVKKRYYAEDLGWVSPGGTAYIHYTNPAATGTGSITCEIASFAMINSPSTPLAHINDGVGFVRYFDIPDGGSPSFSAGFKISIPPGSRLDRIILGEILTVGSGGTISASGPVQNGTEITVEVRRLTYEGFASGIGAIIGNPTVPVGTEIKTISSLLRSSSYIDQLSFDFSSYEEDASQSDKQYIVRISHNDPGNSFRLLYITVDYELSSVENGMGAF